MSQRPRPPLLALALLAALVLIAFMREEQSAFPTTGPPVLEFDKVLVRTAENSLLQIHLQLRISNEVANVHWYHRPKGTTGWTQFGFTTVNEPGPRVQQATLPQPGTYEYKVFANGFRGGAQVIDFGSVTVP